MSVVRTTLAFIAALLLFASSAQAGKIATPLMDKTPVSRHLGGEPYKKISALSQRNKLQRFLVIARASSRGENWIKIRLAQRPNRAYAWVEESRMRISKTQALVKVDLSSRKLSFLWKGKPRWSARVEIGAPATPTPTGLFAVYDRWSTWKYYPGASFGPWVLDLTAHSKALKHFAGGEARIAIHGSQSDSWGRAISNGCVRAPDWALGKLKKQMFTGYPVLIKK